MTDTQSQLKILLSGIEAWNAWRKEHPGTKPDLRGADLSEKNLRDADLSDADLSGADLYQTDLRNANLKMANLSGADLSGVKLSNAALYKARLDSACLILAEMSNADLRHALLTKADLRGVTAREAQLAEAVLEGANLKEADLTGADLTSADMTGANLCHANVAGANLLGLRYGTCLSMRGHYYGIRGLDSCFGNALFVRDAKDQDYLDTIERSIDRTESAFHRKWKRFCFSVWSLFDYGRSLGKAMLLAALLVMVFAGIYQADISYGWGLIDYSSSAQSWFDPIYHSFVTYSTLGLGDIKPQSFAGEVIVVVEVMLGYITLGLLLSILANRVARRS